MTRPWWILVILLLIACSAAQATGAADLDLGAGTAVRLPIESISWPVAILVVGLKLGAAVRLLASSVSGLTLKLEVVHKWDGKPLMNCPWDGAERRSPRGS